MNLSALITIKRLQEMAIEQAKAERERSKKRLSSLKNLYLMAEDDAAKARIDAQMRDEEVRIHALWRWKLDLESAWEEFAKKEWR